MSYEDLEDYCNEFICLNYVLNELHHFTDYDLVAVKDEFHKCVENINRVSGEIINSEWYLKE